MVTLFHTLLHFVTQSVYTCTLQSFTAGSVCKFVFIKGSVNHTFVHSKSILVV